MRKFKRIQDTITLDELRSLLSYDPETGQLTWLRRVSSAAGAGDLANHVSALGYLVVRIRRQAFKVHRVAWLLMTGEEPEVEVDHRDLDRANNRWSNLRLADPSQQQANTRRGPDCGIVQRRSGRWGAIIRNRGMYVTIGTFDTREQACVARRAAELELWGEYARSC